MSDSRFADAKYWSAHRRWVEDWLTIRAPVHNSVDLEQGNHDEAVLMEAFSLIDVIAAVGAELAAEWKFERRLSMTIATSSLSHRVAHW